jgi:hypothetical protein
MAYQHTYWLTHSLSRNKNKLILLNQERKLHGVVAAARALFSKGDKFEAGSKNRSS